MYSFGILERVSKLSKLKVTEIEVKIPFFTVMISYDLLNLDVDRELNLPPINQLCKRSHFVLFITFMSTPSLLIKKTEQHSLLSITNTCSMCDHSPTLLQTP